MLSTKKEKWLAGDEQAAFRYSAERWRGRHSVHLKRGRQRNYRPRRAANMQTSMAWGA